MKNPHRFDYTIPVLLSRDEFQWIENEAAERGITVEELAGLLLSEIIHGLASEDASVAE